nr:CLK4-associating serine/arginine rich protein-like [Ipomoea batatas]
MGSCFSKCKPKNSYLAEVEKDDGEHVKQQAISPAEKPPVSPSPSSASLTSLSSSSAASNSSYSFSSSSCSSKDRSFSNEFLRSCAKENQHVILMKPSKGNLARTSSLRPSLLSSPNAMPLKPSSPRRHVGGSTPKKRPRSNSPTLVRQKSFRKDNLNTSTACHFPNRALRSPSPSRRFLAADGQGKMDISPFRHGGAAFNGVGKHNFKPVADAGAASAAVELTIGNGGCKRRSPDYGGAGVRRLFYGVAGRNPPSPTGENQRRGFFWWLGN